MARKSKVVKVDFLKRQKELEEIELLLKQAEEEEVTKLEKLKEGIDKMVEAEGLFCGVVLTHDDLLNVLKVALLSKDETVNIPYRLYYKE